MPQDPVGNQDEDQKLSTLLADAVGLLCCSAFPAGYLRFGVRNTCGTCKLAVLYYTPSSGDAGYFRKFRVGPHGNIVIDTSGFIGTIQLVNEEDCVPTEGRPMLGDIEADITGIKKSYDRHMQTTQWYAVCEYGHEPWISQYLRYSEVHAQADADAHDAAAHGGTRTATVLPYD
jgi:hypothetical protein